MEFAALLTNYNTFINKMRTRAIVNLKSLKLNPFKSDIQVDIMIFAVIMITIAHTQILH